jgi:hypothetical protein
LNPSSRQRVRQREPLLELQFQKLLPFLVVLLLLLLLLLQVLLLSCPPNLSS